MAAPSPSWHFKLAKESELRIEVAEEAFLQLRLLSGTAQIFSTELPPENWLDVSPRHKFGEYFYGLVNDLSPHSNIANFSDLFVYRIGSGPQAPHSALPIGAEPAADPLRLVHVNINRDLLHLVLAVSYAKEPEEILSRKKTTYLAPCPGHGNFDMVRNFKPFYIWQGAVGASKTSAYCCFMDFLGKEPSPQGILQ